MGVQILQSGLAVHWILFHRLSLPGAGHAYHFSPVSRVEDDVSSFGQVLREYDLYWTTQGEQR